MWTRPFGTYVGGLSADLLGDSLWFVGLTWAVASSTSPQPAGIALAAATIPRVVLMLPAGSLVDRAGAMRVAQAAQVLRTAIMVVLLVTLLVTDLPLPALIVASVVFGVADALRMPASGSLLPALLSREELPAGQGVVSTIYRVATVLAAPAAGALLAWRGLLSVVLVNVVLFATAFAAYAALARRGVGIANDDEPVEGVREGLRYVWARPVIVAMLVVVTLINIAVAGPLELGLALRANQEQWGAGGLGVLFGAFSLGATLGALSLGFWHPRHAPRAGYLCSAASGASLVLMALAPNLLTACAAVAACGLGFGPAGGLLLGGIQSATDSAHIGRVMSLITLTSIGATPLGLFAFGVLTARLPLALAMSVGGAVIVLAALAAAARYRVLPSSVPAPVAQI